MKSLKKPEQDQKPKSFARKKEDFLSSKDFALQKSLSSEAFDSSFGEVKGSFCTSSDSQEDDLIQALELLSNNDLHKKPKEEETNYTTKPTLVLEKETKLTLCWCSPCFLGSELKACSIV